MLIFLGFAGESFKKRSKRSWGRGEQVAIDRFVVRHEAIRVTDDGQKQMVTADVTVLTIAAHRHPAKWFFRKHEESRPQVAIRRSFSEDLYLTLAGYEMQAQAATTRSRSIRSSTGSGQGSVSRQSNADRVDAESAFAFAAARVPAGAVTTALFLLMLFTPAGRCAGTRRGPADRCRRPADAAREGHAAGAGVHLPHVRGRRTSRM